MADKFVHVSSSLHNGVWAKFFYEPGSGLLEVDFDTRLHRWKKNFSVYATDPRNYNLAA